MKNPEHTDAGKRSMPDWSDPELATLTREPFSDPDWLFERKLDGVRCLVFKSGNSARIMSRNKNRLNNTYPELEESLVRLTAEDYIADGEIVTFEGDETSFARLQKRINVSGPTQSLIESVPVKVYLFDLLYYDQRDLTSLPLRNRKALLKEQFDFRDPIRFCTHINEAGESCFEEACRKGWEGVIAKRADSPYTHSRSRDWLKFKCDQRQELVIVGFTDPQGERTGFGALLVGFYDDNGLHYAGKVGTGFTEDQLRDLHKRMKSLETDQPPVVEKVSNRKSIHWIRPEMVAEIGFTEWTSGDKLRHPRYIGLRNDKKPRQVVKEGE